MDKSTELSIGAALLAVALCGFAVQTLRRKLADTDETDVFAQTAPLYPTSIQVSRPKEQLPILFDAAKLRQTLGLESLEHQIRENLGLDAQLYQAHLAPVIDELSLYVQLLPASESHHHAGQGGLLTHMLECAAYASRLTGSYKLPKGASTEVQSRFARHWSLGITLAALLHDVGKPIANLKVSLFGQNPQVALAAWSGLSGNMTHTPQATHYQVEFAHQDYRAHTRLPILLLQSIVPEATRRWLEQEPSLMPAMMRYLSGEATENDAIEEIVTKSDRQSTATNLLKGDKTRFASARAVPLIERILHGVRQQLRLGEFSMNRAGATGFMDPDGETVWFVVAPLLNQTREWLDTYEIRLEGAASLPKDNVRWLDTLQEYGALISNAAGQSVWHIEIDLVQEGGKHWTQTLSVLRFSVPVLYQTGAPKPINGTINIVAEENSSKIDHNQDPTTVSLPPASAIEHGFSKPNQMATGGQALEPETVQPLKPPSESNLEVLRFLSGQAGMGPPDDLKTLPLLPFDPVEPAKTVELTEPSEPTDILPAKYSAKFKPLYQANAGLSVLAQTPVQLAIEGTAQGMPPNLPAVVEHFLNWLKDGLGVGHLRLNEKDSALHIVAEGLAMMSPKIYAEFVNERVDLIDLFNTLGKGVEKATPARVVQKAMESSGLLLLNDQNSRLHKYRAKNGGNSLTMAILGKPQRLIYPLPPENKALVRISGAVRLTND